MRYEIMFITYPSGEIFERAKKKLIDIIELFDGNVISINDWGNKRLACTMQGFDIGRYGLLVFEADPEYEDSISTAVQLAISARSAGLLRHLMIRMGE